MVEELFAGMVLVVVLIVVSIISSHIINLYNL